MFHCGSVCIGCILFVWAWRSVIFDKNIPIPTSARKWDLSQAEIGDSLAFDTEVEADKFAAAIRHYSRVHGTGWGAKKLAAGEKWRVWIVAGRGRKPVKLEPVKLPKLQVFAAPTPLTDEDLQIVVDYRRGESVTLTKPRAIEFGEPEAEETTPTGRRKRLIPE